MKKARKLTALIIVFAMAFSLAITASADGLPVFASATVNGNQLVITFTGADFVNPTGNGLPAVEDFEIAAVPTLATPTAVDGGGVAISERTITLTLTEPIPATAEGVTVTYTPGPTNRLRGSDGDGHLVDGFTESVTNIMPTAPTFNAAGSNVNGNIVTLAFGTRNLFTESSGVPIISQFAFVTAPPIDGLAIQPGGIGVTANAVTLTLSHPIPYGSTLHVSYTRNSNNEFAIRHDASNEYFAADIVSTLIRNATPDPRTVTTTDYIEIPGTGEVIAVNTRLFDVCLPTNEPWEFFIDPLGIVDTDGDPTPGAVGRFNAGAIIAPGNRSVVNNSSIPLHLEVRYSVTPTGEQAPSIIGTAAGTPLETRRLVQPTTASTNLNAMLYLVPAGVYEDDEDRIFERLDQDADFAEGTRAFLFGESERILNFLVPEAEYVIAIAGNTASYELQNNSGHGTAFRLGGFVNPDADWTGDTGMDLEIVFRFNSDLAYPARAAAIAHEATGARYLVTSAENNGSLPVNTTPGIAGVGEPPPPPDVAIGAFAEIKGPGIWGSGPFPASAQLQVTGIVPGPTGQFNLSTSPGDRTIWVQVLPGTATGMHAITVTAPGQDAITFSINVTA